MKMQSRSLEDNFGLGRVTGELSVLQSKKPSWEKGKETTLEVSVVQIAESHSKLAQKQCCFDSNKWDSNRV